MKDLKNKLTERLRRKKLRRRNAKAWERDKIAPFVERLLTRTEVAETSSPERLAEVAFDLYRRERKSIRRVKKETAKSHVSAQFEHFLSEVQGGHSPISGADGITIIDAYNKFLGHAGTFNDAGMTVGTHFGISSSFAHKGRLLYNAVKVFRPRTLLEVGTAYGMSTAFLLSACERYRNDAHLHTIEPMEPQFSLACQFLETTFPGRVDCHKGTSDSRIPAIVDLVESVDLVFHDAAHDGSIYVSDFEKILPSLDTGSILLLDDIRWYDKRIVSSDPGCYSGWRDIVSRREVACAAEIGPDIGVAVIGR